MQKLVVAMMWLALASGLASVASDATADLKAADEGWSKACQAKSLDQFLSFVADDIYISGPDGKWSHGKAAVHDAWAGLFADANFKLSWTVDGAEASKDGRLGYTRGSYQGSMGGKPSAGSYTTVWKKEKDGKWRAVVDIAAGQ